MTTELLLMPGPLTMLEKIVARHTPDGRARRGGFVEIRPRRVMTHDNSAAVIPKFAGLFGGGAARVAYPERLVLALDHDIQNHTPENLGRYARIESFARRHGLLFHRAGRGIGHQLMLERGHVLPGALCVASDSHANAYGALGAVGLPIVRTDAAVLWATGATWWRVPRVVRVELTGRLGAGVSGKDVIVALCGRYPREVRNAAVEFTGEGLGSLSIDDRIAIANMTTEWGAIACVMQADGRVFEYLGARAAGGETDVDVPGEAALREMAVVPDEGAVYDATIRLELSSVSPSVAGPNSVSRVRDVREVAAEGVRIDKAYLLSCVSGRLEDLRAAARVLGGRRFAGHVSFYLAAASAEVERAARADGCWGELVEAGAIELAPGCGPCIGLGEGTVGPREVAISATNRNFPGRMGDRTAEVYLASPAVVVESAIAGRIAGGSGSGTVALRTGIEFAPEGAGDGESEESGAGGLRIEGRAVLVPESSVSTDQIYAGKWTYRDGLTAAEMARVVFENLDPGLAGRIRAGDVLLTGANFGTGSSREQAATALAAAGVRAVVGESVGATYLRNAINNGLLCLECPGLAGVLSELEGDGVVEGRVGPRVELDVGAGTLAVGGRVLRMSALAPFMGELLAAGGLEAWARGRVAEEVTA